MLPSSHFQGFLRSLHTEASRALADSISPPTARQTMYGALTAHRKLDVGNPNAGHIGADFSGLGFSWNEAAKKSPDSVSWKQDIEDLAAWRNAIAHQDFQDRVKLKLTPHRPTLVAADVNAWQTSIERFSSFMDDYLADRLETVIGQRPW